jgi:hypothetical protein
MPDGRFWSMIDDAWRAALPAARDWRVRLIDGERSDEDDDDGAFREGLDTMVRSLENALRELPRDELVAFDRTLELFLYRIDRAEVQVHTDGSDDGFLYCRGFIVALGREYYDAIDRDPSRATMDAECEEMCYLSYHVFADRFGEQAFPRSELCRETGSNSDGWPE